MCGVSLSTVKKLLKSNDIYRYNINPFTKLLSKLGKENSNVITRNYKLAESFVYLFFNTAFALLSICQVSLSKSNNVDKFYRMYWFY